MTTSLSKSLDLATGGGDSSAPPWLGRVKLRHDGSVFWAECPFDDRHVPKGAGFRWDPDTRRWWTADRRSADLLTAYADEEAAKALDSQEAALGRLRPPGGRRYLPYQIEAIRYALDHEGTLIADEMGLGKTVQAIGVMDASRARHVLIVAPLTVKPVWIAEIERWSSFSRTLGIATAKYWPEQARTVLVHPEIVARHEGAITARTWDLVVVDEAHIFRNFSAARTAALFGSPHRGHPGVHSLRRLALTGTPVPNRPRELYSLVNFLQPGRWGKKHDFEERFCDAGWGEFGWEADGASRLGELHHLLRERVMVRRLKADVLTELPPKRRRVVAWQAEDLGAGVERALNTEHKALTKAGIDTSRENWEEQVGRLSPRGTGFEGIATARKDMALAKVPAVVAYV